MTDITVQAACGQAVNGSVRRVNMTEKEHHKVDASDGKKQGVVALLQAITDTAKELPADRRYDVHIEIEEAQ